MKSMREQYVENVLEIHEEQPEYHEGGDGSEGKCDCVGLGIGAMRRMGIEYDGLHGSNWAARNEAVELWKIESIKQLSVGDNVLKAYKPGESGWDLPDRYEKHPDQNDYYHFGVVVSVNPLKICHCTSPTTKIDTKLGRWSHAFLWKQLSKPVQEVNLVAICKRKVVLNSGHLNLRAGPSSADRDIGDIPNGAIVEVLTDGDWPFIRYKQKCGYVLGTYLEEIPEENDTPSFVPNNGIIPNNTVVPNNSESAPNNLRSNSNDTKITIIDSVGNHFEPVGDFRVLRGSID